MPADPPKPGPDLDSDPPRAPTGSPPSTDDADRSPPASDGPGPAGLVPDGEGGVEGDDEEEGEGDGTPRGRSDPEAVIVEDGPGGREVVVPLALYKRVTVVSTLAAMVFVVLGFVVLDRATNRASLPASQIDPWLALAGLGLIVAGAVTYAFSTRFRAAGMGSSKTDEDGGDDDG